MRVRIDNAGQFGLVTDISAVEPPPNAWTNTTNCRFSRGAAKPFSGFAAQFTPAGTAHYVIGFDKAGTWTVCYPADAAAAGAAEKLYSYDGSAEVDRTRASANYTAATSQWNGTFFQGVALFNNYGVAPQYWTASATTFADLVYKFNVSGTALTWDNFDDASHAYRAKVIRPFKAFLVALYIKENGVEYPHLVHWSNAADPGTIPTSWAYNDPTVESGRTDLADTQGYLVDALALRDVLVIYKEDAIWLMSFIGGQFVFNFEKLTDAYGLLAQECAVDIGGRHLCVGKNVVYLHDGHSITPLLEGRAADVLFGEIDNAYKHLTFTAHNRLEREAWICYCPSGQTVPNRALVWDYDADTWTKRDIPPIRHASQQALALNRASWPTASATDNTWDTSQLSWDDGSLSTMFIGAGASLWRFDYLADFAASAPAVTLERTGLRMGEAGQMVQVKAIYPRATGDAFRVQAGAQRRLTGSVAWQPAQVFTPGTDAKVDCRITGEAVAVRFSSNDGAQWALSGYELDVEPVARR